MNITIITGPRPIIIHKTNYVQFQQLMLMLINPPGQYVPDILDEVKEVDDDQLSYTKPIMCSSN